MTVTTPPDILAMMADKSDPKRTPDLPAAPAQPSKAKELAPGADAFESLSERWIRVHAGLLV